MANKQVIRLTESDLRKVIKESVNNILTEESYRKAAKQGDNTSVANKKELKRKKRDGYKNASRDFHKFAKKHNLDKMKSGASAVCNWEDGCDDNGRYVANENLSELDLHKIIKESVNRILNEETKNSKDPYDIIFLSDYTPKDILNGQFDDMIWDDKWCDEFDYYGEVEYLSAIAQRKMILNKDLAMKYGRDPSVSTRKPFGFELNGDMNPNMYDTTSREMKFNDYTKAQLGRTADAAMYYAKNASDDNAWKGLLRNIRNKEFNGRNPNTQKLHTKGSLNRDLIAMDKAKK